MWETSRIVMIALLNLHSDKMLIFSTYKILATQFACDSNCSSGVYIRMLRISAFSDVFCHHQCSVTCWHVTKPGCSSEFQFSAGCRINEVQASDGFMVPTVSCLRYTTFPCRVFEIMTPVLSYRCLNLII